jgi:activator of HSP90 ATPase
MKNIKQTIIINAPIEEVYKALTDPKLHSKFTGSKAKNTDKLGKFSTFDGYSHGKNLVLKENAKIVQEWSCDDFPKDHFTKVTFELKQQENNTKLTFTQTKVPDENYYNIYSGWEEFYWKPLKQMLEN